MNPYREPHNLNTRRSKKMGRKPPESPELSRLIKPGAFADEHGSKNLSENPPASNNWMVSGFHMFLQPSLLAAGIFVTFTAGLESKRSAICLDLDLWGESDHPGDMSRTSMYKYICTYVCIHIYIYMDR